jgi:SAM-dependent methyltransferase
MIDSSSFESRRFRTAADHYLAGRPPYAPGLLRRVAECCGLREEHRVLDLGCGPGQLSLALAFFAGSVVAVDPEPEMLRVAAAVVEGIAPNVELVLGSSDDLSPRLGSFRMAVMGRSFHWMDRTETLRRLDALVEPGGAVVLLNEQHPEVPDNAWLAGYDALLERYAGSDPVRAGRKASPWGRHEGFLLDSPFSRLERIGIIERRRIAAGRLVDRALSQSSTSRARLGAEADRLAAEIAAYMAGVAPDGTVTEVVESTATVARRPTSGASAVESA